MRFGPLARLSRCFGPTDTAGGVVKSADGYATLPSRAIPCDDPVRSVRESMSEQNPTAEEVQTAIAFLHSRGRRVEAIRGDKAGLYSVDGRLSTKHDVMRHAIAAGLFTDPAPRRRT